MNALTSRRPKSGEYTLIAASSALGAYKIVTEEDYDIAFERFYLTYTADELLIEQVADAVFDGKSRAMIAVARTLEEVGTFDKKHGMSEVMYLEKLGLLDRVDALVGGVWLDKEDVDLLVHRNCPLILTPSFDMGYGHGIPEAAMYAARGLKMGLGTEDCKFNPEADVEKEAWLLSQTVSALMRRENALTETQLSRLISFA